MERRLQILTNVAFLSLCLVGVALGVKVLISPPAAPTFVAGAAPPVRPQPPLYKDGERIAVPGVSFGQAEYTLLLVTQKGCRYCDQSMPFYKSLGADQALAKNTKIVLLAPDDEGVSREELAKYGVRVDQVVRVSLDALKVRGTPTAIVVNRSGQVIRALPGLLDESRQAQLMVALRGPKASN